MTEQITLAEVAETEVGRTIIAQRNEAAQAKADAEEATRKERADELHAEAERLTKIVTEKRAELLTLVENMANVHDELSGAFAGLELCRRRLRPLDEKLMMPPTRIKEREIRRLVERLRRQMRTFWDPM